MGMNFKAFGVLGILTFSLAAQAAQGPYPLNPDDHLTPGSLCVNPTNYRYAERVPYCERNVSGQEKSGIINTYDQTLGYQIDKLRREDFKIDHLIPLCVGGSNERTNLWPQNKEVYVKTDLIEDLLCQLMGKGRLKQHEAVEIVLNVKHHLETSESVKQNLLQRLKN